VSGTYESSKEWIFAFDMAVVDILAQRPDVENPQQYRIRAELCSKHGRLCVQVTYGAILDHFAWSQTQPTRLAESLLQTMLPPPRA